MAKIGIIFKKVDHQYMIDNYPNFKGEKLNNIKYLLCPGQITINKTAIDWFELDNCSTGFFGDLYFDGEDDNRTVRQLIEWFSKKPKKNKDFMDYIQKIVDKLNTYDKDLFVDVS